MFTAVKLLSNNSHYSLFPPAKATAYAVAFAYVSSIIASARYKQTKKKEPHNAVLFS